MNRLTFAELFYTGTSFPIDVIALFTHSNPSLFSFSLEDSMKDMYSSSSCLDSFLRYMYKMPGRCPRIDVGPDQCRTAPCSSVDLRLLLVQAQKLRITLTMVRITTDT